MVAAYVHMWESSAAADHHREVANQAEWWKNETLLISKLYSLKRDDDCSRFPEKAHDSKPICVAGVTWTKWFSLNPSWPLGGIPNELFCYCHSFYDFCKIAWLASSSFRYLSKLGKKPPHRHWLHATWLERIHLFSNVCLPKASS